MKITRAAKRLIGWGLQTFFGKKPGNLDAQVAELRRRFPSTTAETDIPASQAAWHTNAARLEELVRKSDPRYFLRWDVIQRTMAVVYDAYIRLELAQLKSLTDWALRWEPAIEESGVGGPMPFPFYPRSSANLIHLAHHVAEFENRTRFRADHLQTVVEFGGGYGAMCRLFRRLGFKGRYVIFDLPQFSALQRFYLSSVGAEGECICDFNVLRKVVHAHHGTSLFLSTWALSETPIQLRTAVIELVKGFDAFLFAYQDRFNEVDNTAFFSRLRIDLASINWHQLHIAHIPGNNSYLFGARP